MSKSTGRELGWKCEGHWIVAKVTRVDEIIQVCVDKRANPGQKGWVEEEHSIGT